MKNLSSAWINALNMRRYVIRVFTWFDIAVGPFGTGPYGFWNDVGDVVIDGTTYRGSGTLASISAAAGVGDMSVPGLQITLSGLSTDVLETFFEEEWHQRATKVSIGLLSPDTRNLIDTPDVYFGGYLDNAKLTTGAGATSALVVSCEDASRRMTRTFANVRSDADQRERDPTDTLFKNVTVAAQQTVYWGQATPAGANGSRSGAAGGDEQTRVKNAVIAAWAMRF